MGKTGDFTHASAAKRAAEEYNQDERSARERAADKAKRAPVTTDYRRWKSDPAGLDFPGVDTPTRSPGVLPKDLKQRQKPDLSARARNERPSTPVGRTTRDLEKQELARQDISLGPGEAFDGTGAVGMFESDDQFGTTDEFGRYDKTPREEAREIDQAAASMERTEPFDPFDMSDSSGVLNAEERDTLAEQFGEATEVFDEITSSDRRVFYETAVGIKKPAVERGFGDVINADGLAADTTNKLLDRRR